MTVHRKTSDELTELASQLSAEAQHLYGTEARRKETLRAAEDATLKITGEAESRDGSVHVTVDASGMLLELALTAEALRAGPTELAGKVTQVAQQAAAGARAAVRQVYEPLRAEGIGRGLPVLPPPEPVVEPTSPAKHERRKDVEEEASFEERTITRRARHR